MRRGACFGPARRHLALYGSVVRRWPSRHRLLLVLLVLLVRATVPPAVPLMVRMVQMVLMVLMVLMVSHLPFAPFLVQRTSCRPPLHPHRGQTGCLNGRLEKAHQPHRTSPTRLR